MNRTDKAGMSSRPSQGERLRAICMKFRDEDTAVCFFREKGILHQQRRCPCGHLMKLTEKRSGQARRWRCHRAQCRTEVSLRTGTWFQGHKLDFRTAVLFVYSWSHGYTTTEFCSKEFGMSTKSVVDWKKSLREVAAESVLKDPLVIGGPGLTVEVEETALTKRKCQRGPQQWVFGGFCRETGECFLVPIGGRSGQALIPLIKQYVKPGTTVITDHWRGHHSLSEEDYAYLKTSHSLNFVHPKTGVHKRTVVSSEEQAKSSIKPRRGTRKSLLASCELVWRRRLRPEEDPFDRVIDDIAAYWPPHDVFHMRS